VPPPSGPRGPACGPWSARPRPATLTTPAATGAFRLQFDNPEEVALVREGLELYSAYADRAGLPGYDIGLRAQGYLFCARDDRRRPTTFHGHCKPVRCVRAPGTAVPEWCANAPNHRRVRFGTSRSFRSARGSAYGSSAP
jgi:hypothetical protein